VGKKSQRRGDAALLDRPLQHDSDVTGWRAWLDVLDIPLKPRARIAVSRTSVEVR
jgi:LysR family glycine cleavage system transcriptional activator